MRTRMMLVAAVAAAVLVAAAGAANNRRYADVRDDAATAPDVTDVSVANDDAGLIMFRVTFANRTALDPEDEIDLGLDADRQLTTGHNGLDYIFGVYQGAKPFFATWSDSEEDWVDVAAPSYRFAWEAGNTATFTIDRRDLGWTPGFEFYVGAWDSAAEEPSDYAPSDDDRWAYSLRLPFALRVAPTTTFDLSTTAPRAGKQFTLATRVVRDDTGATLHSGKVTCKAAVAGKLVRAASPGRFFTITAMEGGDFTQAICDWKLPPSAKGKTLQASTTVSLSGKSVTRTYTGKVR